MLRVENVTQVSVLADACGVADTPWTRLKGLIGVTELPQGAGLVIRPCRGVHCMFMSIPIDVVYVDRNDRVVAVDEVLRPWAIGRIYRRCAYVVELPAGTVAQTRTAPGDQLRLAEAEQRGKV